MKISRDTTLFLLIGLFHLLLWTFLPWWIQPSSATSDVMEAFAASREWVMGTIKHPALPFWTLETVYQLTGRATFAVYLACTLWMFLGLWAVWRLSKEFLSPNMALVSVLAVTTYRYFNIGGINYTSSVPAFHLWCVAITLFYLALRYDRRRDWLLLGLALGAGFLSKYTVVILIATMVSWMILSPTCRRYWKTTGPYMTMAVSAAVFLPHVLWVVSHRFTTILYAQDALAGGPSEKRMLLDHLVNPAEFLGSQVFLFLPILIPLIPISGFAWQLRWKKSVTDGVPSPFPAAMKMDSWLSFMIFVPVLFHVLIGGVTGAHLRTAYGSVLWPFFGLWTLSQFQITETALSRKRSVALSATVLAVILGCYVLNYQFYYYVTPDIGCRIHFPGLALAESVERIWQEQGEGDCPWLSGDWKLASHAAYRMKNRPRVLCYYYGLAAGQRPICLNMSDDDINRDGGIVLWEESDVSKESPPNWLFQRYPTAVVAMETLVIPWQTTAKPPPLRIRYAVIVKE